QFVFIIAGTILCTALILVPITRKQYTGWRVSSAIVHSGIIIYYDFQFLRWAILSEAVKCGKAFFGY
ncbi:hypothetical protein BD408DRAFT_422691, partial [Parasitella parasitica]